MFVPAGTNAEIGAADRENIEGRHGFDKNARVAVDHACDEGAETDSPGYARQKIERAIAFEHRLIGFADHLDLKKMIHHPQTGKTGFLSRLADARQRWSNLLRTAGPRKRRYLKSQLHDLTSRRAAVPTVLWRLQTHPNNSWVRPKTPTVYFCGANLHAHVVDFGRFLSQTAMCIFDVNFNAEARRIQRKRFISSAPLW